MVITTQEQINGAAVRFQADNANDDTVAAVFKWSNPAPRIDGTTPKPWRVADACAAMDILKGMGFADAYVLHEGVRFCGGIQLCVKLWSGPIRLGELLSALKAAGHRARWVNGRVVWTDKVKA